MLTLNYRLLELSYWLLTFGAILFTIKVHLLAMVRWLNITRERLEKVRGKILTTQEVLKTFGYSPKTNIGDTQLYKRGVIKPVGKNTWLVDEDLITMIEDLIERRRKKN